PIGRPYLTRGIDGFTRCVLGRVVRLEAPSAVSLGLCRVHVACDKRPWLEGLNIEMEWPMSGKPRLLYLDNAAEFKSEALRRGCEQHGIRLDYRPLGQPHYGGIVERIIGTAMQMICLLYTSPSPRAGLLARMPSCVCKHRRERGGGGGG
ncbi:integrase catalytic domain-containing protein, partial [Citrobacter portucalensis]|uniref:integrase catalytic domain-containing protein n=1 Tax=Citrobacter portucalensis TaxID=1639133 RepID=UPI0021CDB3D2